MDTKTYSNNFRLKKTKTWKSKYIEKKNTEAALYAFQDLEIRKFIQKFFKDNGLIVHNCQINYSDVNSLHIFISYYLTLKSISLINNTNKKQNIKLIKRKTNIKQKKRYITIKKNIKNYTIYQRLNYNRNLNKYIPKRNSKRVKNIIQSEKKSLKIRRVNLLKYYKNYITIKKYKKLEEIQINTFLEKFFESLHLFFCKKVTILLTLKQLNKDLKQTLSPEKSHLLKKKLVNLKKYEQNEFFKEGVNILFTCITKLKSADLLAQFISSQLQILKRHNFFLRFLKTTLTIFKNSTFSKIEGIKIKIKGRFNGAPRAKHKTITIGRGVPALTLNSSIDYSEKTAYTSNGTFGVKVLIYEN